ncbi:protein of unknown function Met10 [Pyrolobus fumarii 1A]|uniref:SAM-dependent methyltransferase TRM5/TYW2-type domain-containing protein n=1 Tax=Pyrolobus fumarii (strain DSM 11204 / 1A) TaxID=694429 RepID=G0EED7_PYRF1|nr:hypothetical protein [Pyrolobus fumarii]AEM37978.1 protein of unknown function Met10 [Pyrolobus fumarii 1A]
MEKRFERIAYVTIGEVAIINVKRDEDVNNEQVKKAAEEIMRRHKRIKAVYAKIETTGAYRVPKLYLVLGDPVEETWHRENGIDFHVTIGRVYVNPRLSTEHLRVAQIIDEYGCRTLLDAFTGIGGYAVTASIHTRSLSRVVANDLNPYAIRDLLLTLHRNRRRLKANIIVTNVDAHTLPRMFKHASFDSIILDLPHESIKFVSIPCSLASSESIVIFYVVAHENDVHQVANHVATKLAECGLECDGDDAIPVIDYAPRQYVYRILFRCRRG